MRLDVWKWTRRVLVGLLLVILVLLSLAASASPRGASAFAFAVLATAYVAGTLIAACLTSRWIWRHRAVVVVTAMVAAHFRGGKTLWGKRLFRWPRLWDYRVEGEIVHYAFLMPVGMTLTRLNQWREAVEQGLDRAVDWRYEGGLYHLRVIGSRMPARVSFGEVYGPAPAGELVFAAGVDRLGTVWADLTGLPHLLVGGTTGGGKSVFLRQMIAYLALMNPPERLRLALVDLKGGIELNVFERLPHRLGPVLREWEQCTALLENLDRELASRQAAFAWAGMVDLGEWNRRHPGKMLPYLALVIDELAELTAVESADRAERASRQAQLALLTRICRLGRAAGIHVIAATQRPDSDAVPGQVKANMPATMAFRVRDPVNSRVLLGDGHPEAASLPQIPGRGIWQVDGQVEVQAPWLSREEAAALLGRAYPPESSGHAIPSQRATVSARSQPATTLELPGEWGTDRVTLCPTGAAEGPR